MLVIMWTILILVDIVTVTARSVPVWNSKSVEIVIVTVTMSMPGVPVVESREMVKRVMRHLVMFLTRTCDNLKKKNDDDDDEDEGIFLIEEADSDVEYII